MKAIPSADEVLSSLRPFQRSTATYAFSRLYDAKNPSLRFLVADEAGLGKTLVARGVIAQVVEHLHSIGHERIDIVYICSNGTIARQNLRKLNIADDTAIIEADRLTVLPNEIHRLEQRSLNLIAITPGTSLKFGSPAGKFQERALIYAVLKRIWGDDVLCGSGAERVFYLGINDDMDAPRRLHDEVATMTPSDSVCRAFEIEIDRVDEGRQLDNEPNLRDEFVQLANAFEFKDGASQEQRDRRNRFLVELRMATAVVGIEMLQPDLVILDEFQRFRTLLDPANQDWANRLARTLFDYRDPDSGRRTRTLLLSATPYRPYTTMDDVTGDTHFADFVQTAHFLFSDESKANALKSDLGTLHRSIQDIEKDGGKAAAVAACQLVSDRLRPVMARTERLASTPDRSGMLESIELPVELERSDVDGYLAVARAARLLQQYDVIEYWKSGPYLLNFMEGYALKNAFENAAKNDSAVPGLRNLVRTGLGMLSWKDISAYERVDPANARLRALTSDTIGRDVWRLLWLPPSLPYYRGESGSVFESSEARTFTKRLVFSSWNLVPKVISSMLSYEAERKIFGRVVEEGDRTYDEYGLRPDRRLAFRLSANEPASMTVLNIVVPYVELARIADPLAISSELRLSGRDPSRSDVEGRACRLVAEAIHELVAASPKDGPVDQRWYWAIPILLEQQGGDMAASRWWRAMRSQQTWTRKPSEDDTSTGFQRHLLTAEKLLANPDTYGWGRVPDDLVEVIAATALGSPAVCALRSLSRVTGLPLSHDEDLAKGAARIAWGFRALLNAPDATAIIRANSEVEAYWRAVLDYSVDGHLQATLDEYVHVLKEWRGFLAISSSDILKDLADTAYDALSLQTANYAVDVPVANDSGISVDRRRMRGRFAVRFGDQAMEGEQGRQRAENVSKAFNSPFWPFVLTTTSIGQEGLDFHLYSHAVVHWNLPSNPVDFEQREGRVHRYKGHAVRKNVATSQGLAAFERPDSDPWVAMFQSASSQSQDDGGVTPYWVYNAPGTTARIERYVPALPFSSDVTKLEKLLRDVATYRLSLGQPRQEELLKLLEARISISDLESTIQGVRVDLSPPAVPTPSVDG